jgi:hypothetical protein
MDLPLFFPRHTLSRNLRATVPLILTNCGEKKVKLFAIINLKKQVLVDNFDSLNPIGIDGRVRASLDWTSAIQKATAEVDAGRQILWQMDLGLFSRLDLPLSNQMQWQALYLSLEQFLKTVWKDFQAHSAGLVIYAGEIDFSKNFPWDATLVSHWQGWLQDRFGSINALNDECGLKYSSFDEAHPKESSNTPLSDLVKLFCRDTVADYLNMLVSSISDSLPLYMHLRASEPLDPLLFYQLSTAERFGRFHLIFEEGFCKDLAGGSRRNKEGKQHSESINVGICLPGAEIVKPSLLRNLQTAISQLQKTNISYVVIPEEHLIQQWEGLDYILYSSKGLASQGKRKLQGFCAAAGIAVAVDDPMGLSNEILFTDFLKQQLLLY